MSNNEESSSSESSSSDDPARDFVPPPSHVRSGSNRSVQSVRTSPVIGSGNRAALPPEEELAWRAAREQLQNAGAWMQGGADRRQQQQSSSSSTSSLGGTAGNVHDALGGDLFRGPVGSFAEDSPPRAMERRPSPPLLSPPRRPSPPLQHAPAPPGHPYYPGYYPPLYFPPAQPQHLYQPPSSQQSNPPPYTQRPPTLYGYPGYPYGYQPPQRLQPPQPPQPPPIEAPSGEETNWNALIADLADPFAKRAPQGGAQTTTPPKKKPGVFRSPPSSGQKKSPMFQASPNISFGMDTPGGEMEDFSPMGPTFAGFGEFEDSKPFTPGKLNLSSSDEEEVAFGTMQQPPKPFAGSIDDFAPMGQGLQGVRRSPVQSSSDRKVELRNAGTAVSASRPAKHVASSARKAPPTKAASKAKAPSTHPRPRPSPVSAQSSSAVKPRNIWLDQPASTGNVRRVTMGGPQGSMSRSLAGINSMMRGQTEPAVPVSATPQSERVSPRVSDPPPPQHQPKLSLPPPPQPLHQLPSTLPQRQRQEPSHQTQPQLQFAQQQTSTSRHQPQNLPQHQFIAPGQQHALPYPQAQMSSIYAQRPSGTPTFPPGFTHRPASSPHMPPGYAQQPNITPKMPPEYARPPGSSPMLPLGYASTPKMPPVYAQRPASSQSTPHSAARHSPSGPQYARLPSASRPQGSSPPVSISASRQTPGHLAPPASTGKENPSAKRSAASASKGKSTPCNCKKSRCLKLYCECFAEQVFCDGCNCTECLNTKKDVVTRDKAIKEILSKNRAAFESRTPGSHATGCKCRRSECLKKYCECFQSGLVCNSKCKCINCANLAGSQKLIDKRRKMKDTRGAEYAMQIAQEEWERPASSQKQPPRPTHLSSRAPTPSPAFRGQQQLQGVPMSHRGNPRKGPMPHPQVAPHFHPRPPYLGPPMMGSMGFSPMSGGGGGSASHVTPGFSIPGRGMPRSAAAPSPAPTVTAAPTIITTSTTTTTSDATAKRQAQEITPAVATAATARTSRNRGVRLFFDPSSSRKKHKVGGSYTEEVLSLYFGTKLPPQSQTAVLTVFSFLSNEDLYRAGLVCKEWSALALGEALWKFG